eukprot:1181631-Prorocentrum_minimum.AAC.1
MVPPPSLLLRSEPESRPLKAPSYLDIESPKSLIGADWGVPDRLAADGGPRRRPASASAATRRDQKFASQIRPAVGASRWASLPPPLYPLASNILTSGKEASSEPH